MAHIEELTAKVKERFAAQLQATYVHVGELTIEISTEHLREVCLALRDEADFKFEMLVDLCGVDYYDYGISQWLTEKATATGFERAVDLSRTQRYAAPKKARFAVVYHLLSLTNNQRIALRVFVENESLLVPSVYDIWGSVNWYEREAFDLYGILFDGHPDLRRILTDYGFIGHPFRKDFPLIGEIEVRYDATLQRVIYEPVSIEPRTLVPKVIREAESNLEPKEG